MLRNCFGRAILLAPLALSSCATEGAGDDVDNTLGSDDLDAGRRDSGPESGDDSTSADDDVSSVDDDVVALDDAGDEDTVDFGPGSTPVGVEEPVPVVVEPEPTGPVPNADNPLMACASAVAVGEDPMIDDFEDLNDVTLEVDNRAGGWYWYNDEAVGGIQLLEWSTTADPAESGSGVLHVQGSGFPEYSGIGVGLRWTETGSEFCYYDASYYDGISFWARGSSSMRVAMQNPSVRPVAEGGRCPSDASCYDSHGLDVAVTDGWTHFKVGFAGVEQAGWGTPVGAFVPQELFTIEFQFPAGASYDIQIDDLAFYSDDEAAVEPEPAVEPPVVEPVDEADAGVDAGTRGEPAEAGVPVSDAGL